VLYPQDRVTHREQCVAQDSCRPVYAELQRTTGIPDIGHLMYVAKGRIFVLLIGAAGITGVDYTPSRITDPATPGRIKLAVLGASESPSLAAILLVFNVPRRLRWYAVRQSRHHRWLGIRSAVWHFEQSIYELYNRD